MAQSVPMAEFTYPEVGATGQDVLPAGYRHARVRAQIGTGRASFEAAARGVMTWAVHRRAGLRVRATAERAAPGVMVISSVGIGPLRLRLPCEVVWAVEEADRAGFAYGTHAGHPASGEEAFVVEIDDDHVVWFTVTAFSRPATWYARLGGPATHAAQSYTVRRYVAAARSLARASRDS